MGGVGIIARARACVCTELCPPEGRPDPQKVENEASKQATAVSRPKKRRDVAADPGTRTYPPYMGVDLPRGRVSFGPRGLYICVLGTGASYRVIFVHFGPISGQ